LKTYLQERGVPAMIYYPVPLYKQAAFHQNLDSADFPVTEYLCEAVFSLPMHSELNEEILEQITGAVKAFFSEPT